MNENDLKEYAEYLILDHSTDIEWLSIFEMFEDYDSPGELSEADARKVSELISKAKITITWE